jgi:hypothetical protein
MFQAIANLSDKDFAAIFVGAILGVILSVPVAIFIGKRYYNEKYIEFRYGLFSVLHDKFLGDLIRIDINGEDARKLCLLRFDITNKGNVSLYQEDILTSQANIMMLDGAKILSLARQTNPELAVDLDISIGPNGSVQVLIHNLRPNVIHRYLALLKIDEEIPQRFSERNIKFAVELKNSKRHFYIKQHTVDEATEPNAFSREMMSIFFVILYLFLGIGLMCGMFFLGRWILRFFDWI